MAKYRTPQQWLALIKQQQQSDMTIKAFCNEHQLSLSSFYRQKSMTSTSSEAAFAQAVIAPEPLSVPDPAPSSFKHEITLTTQVGELAFPAQIAPSVIVEIIKGLQHDHV